MTFTRVAVISAYTDRHSSAGDGDVRPTDDKYSSALCQEEPRCVGSVPELLCR